MFLRSIILLCVVCGGASAQVHNFETPGNLEPTVQLDCLTVEGVGPEITPADLATGVRACVAANEYDLAARMLLLLQVRAVFDSKRVTDRSAHGAGQALSIELGNSWKRREQRKLQAALESFGGTGSAAHGEFCAVLVTQPAPSYVPTYMIAHGMRAIIAPTENVLVENFDSDAAWRTVLVEYLKCRA